MTDGEKRRHGLFVRYAEHLNFLKDTGVLHIDLKYELTYICPLCTNQFSVDNLNQELKNPLTLEDAPPKALGGHANVLTCKTCNNASGQKIDVHLTKRMVEMDQQKFVPGIAFATKFEKDGQFVQGIVEVSKEGAIQVSHDEKKNNPKILDEYRSKTGRDSVINIAFNDARIDAFKLQLALLKTGLLLTFEKYGYSFLLDPIYDRIREQLRNPSENSYPTDFWFTSDTLKKYYGVPFVMESGVEAIFPMFPLKTEFSERSFGVIIPLSTKPIEEVIANINSKFERYRGFEAAVDPMEGADYLFDLDAIKHMLTWVKKIKDN